jgi:hypothetical protein
MGQLDNAVYRHRAINPGRRGSRLLVARWTRTTSRINEGPSALLAGAAADDAEVQYWNVTGSSQKEELLALRLVPERTILAELGRIHDPRQLVWQASEVARSWSLPPRDIEAACGQLAAAPKARARRAPSPA